MNSPVFQAVDLNVTTTDGTPIVAGVDLEGSAGQLVGLLGETGAGKTLTARAVLGLLPRGLRATGKVRFGDGEWISLDDPHRVTQHLGRTAGLMLQNPAGAFDPLQRIGPQLIEAVVRNKLMSKPAAIQRAIELCKKLGLGDGESVFRRYPHELSGGMAQRVALALTLMPGPRLLVVDEPTSALDANLRVEALNLIRSIALERGMAVLLVSHDLGLVSHFCDRLVVLYAGHVMERGETSSVLHSPAHPYSATLISCALRLARPARTLLPTVGGEPPLPGEWPAGCTFHSRCPDAQERCQIERPSLSTHGDRLVACHFARLEERV